METTVETVTAPFVINRVYCEFTMDYTSEIHFAMNVNGQWFRRMRSRDVRFGYTNTAWRLSNYGPGERARLTASKARLPR